MVFKNLLLKSNSLPCRKSVRLLFMLLLASFCSVSLSGQSMHFLHTDISETVFPVNQLESLVFSRSTIFEINQTNQTPQTFNAREIERVTFMSATNLPEISLKNQSNVSFFPNPVVDFFNIQTTGEALNINLVEIVSLNGSVVLKEVLNPTRDIYQVNLSFLSPGLYIGKIQMGNTFETIKIYKK